MKEITIPIEEYKELLLIKGKYEELKSIYYGPYSNTKITYRGIEDEAARMVPPYKFTCGEGLGVLNDKS